MAPADRKTIYATFAIRIYICAHILIFLAYPASASPVDQERKAESAALHVVALLPVFNLTDSPEAIDKFIVAMVNASTKLHLSILTPTEARPVLRKHRIRAIGSVDQQSANLIARELGVEYCLLANINFYSNDISMAAGASLRLVRLSDLQIVMAQSRTSFSKQYIGWFGKGEVLQIDTLFAKLADDLLNHSGIAEVFTRPLPSFSREGADKGKTIALVPFDNLGEWDYADQILSGYVISGLAQSGLRVVEPGEVNKLFRLTHRWPRGEVGFKLMDLLRDSLGVDYALTGAIDEFQVDALGRSSHLSAGARLLNVHTREIVAVAEVSRSDKLEPSILATGHGYPGDVVMVGAAHELISKLGISNDMLADSGATNSDSPERRRQQ